MTKNNSIKTNPAPCSPFSSKKRLESNEKIYYRLQDRQSRCRMKLIIFGIIFGLIFLVFYLLKFLVPYYEFPRVPVFTHLNIYVKIIYFSLWGIIYLYLFKFLKDLNSQYNFKKIIFIFVIIFNLTLLLIPPFLSGDITGYIYRAGIINEYHKNPYLVAPSQIEAKPFTNWPDMPLTHGPFWAVISSALNKIAGSDINLNIYIFKIFAIIINLICIFLIYSIINKIKPQYGNLATILYAWNPLILLAVANNGHNDVLIILFFLLAVYLAINKKIFYVLPVLILSVLVKYIAVLFLPFFFLYLLRHLKSKKDKITFFIKQLFFCSLIIFICFLPFWQGFRIFLPVINQAEVFTVIAAAPIALFISSILNIQRLFVESASLSNIELTRTICYAIFFIFYFYILIAKRKESLEILIKNMFWVILLFLFTTTFWLMPWYFLWILPVLILVTDKKYYYLLIFLTSVTLLSYAFPYSFDFLAVFIILIFLHITVRRKKIKEFFLFQLR